MRANCFRFLPVLVVCGLFAATVHPAFAGTDSSSYPSFDPQIVRLSYVEGDVRITRGPLADKQDIEQNGASTGWEQAVSNLPIESGNSIVTGKGRAEIEFEDASTVYLAENSVLIFTRLTSMAGVPYTEIALLSGTATMNVHTTVDGEWFKMTTPTDTISIGYPRKAVWRIDSYLDAVSITPQRDPSLTEMELVSTQAGMLGKTTSYKNGERVSKPVTADVAASARWDAWVEHRLVARAEAMAVTMKEAGLKEPISGLADMKDKGHFFACAPYGTCWEPTNGWEGKPNENVASGPATSAVAAKPAKAAKAAKPTKSEVYLAANPGATLYTEDFFFPCNTFAVQDVIAIDPVTHKQKVIDTYFDLNSYPNLQMMPVFGSRWPYRLFMSLDDLYPWDWAICHSGSWIRWNHHYAWVAGRNRHYDCPVWWVRNGRTVGFVPIHPRDVLGKPPVNLKDGLLKFTGNHAQPYTHVTLQPDKTTKLLLEPPKEFRKQEVAHLENAQAPTPVAHSAFAALLAAKGVTPLTTLPTVKGTVFANHTAGQNPEQGNSELRSSQTRKAEAASAGTPILFDRKSQTFSVERQVNVNGRSLWVQEPIGRVGNYPVNNPGNNGRVRGTTSAYSNGGNSPQDYNRGTSSGSYTPYSTGNSGGGQVQTYSPPPSYSPPSNAGSYSAPSAPPPSPPMQSAPVQSYSPPAGAPTPSGPVGK